MANNTPSALNIFNSVTAADSVSNVTTLFNSLRTDDKLALLWFAYTEMGRSITPAAPGAARLQFAEGLLKEVKQMNPEAQLQFMRDLANKVNNPQTRAYGILTVNTKLAFWYQLAELMKAGTVIPVPRNYRMTRDAVNVLKSIQSLEFSQQITLLRNCVVNMGVDPLA